MRRPWLGPLVPVYRAVQALEWRQARRLGGRVVSVGSLSAGGAGKTPVVMLVVEMLREAGFAVDVLSRGYRRSGKGVEPVDAGGSAERYGDEPMMMARRLGVPVWVGADRYAAGLAAETEGGPGPVHVLDDGFQHRRLRRDADVVLLTQEDVEDRLLPAGNLREGLDALGRASVVVLREEEADRLRSLVPAGKPVWVVRRTLHLDREIPGKLIVFCGIARPHGFLGMLHGLGVAGAGSVTFQDHHRYDMQDVEMLTEMGMLGHASGFCTTEKDAVKLTAPMLRRLDTVGPVATAWLSVDLVEGNLHDLGLSAHSPALGENSQSLPSNGVPGGPRDSGEVKS